MAVYSACVGSDGRVLCLLQELKLLNEGISKFPYFHKFYLMLGQLEERRGSADAARQAYQAGLKRCMGSAPLWRSLSRLEEQAGMIGKARNVLEQVRCMQPPHSCQQICQYQMFDNAQAAPSAAQPAAGSHALAT